MCCNDDSTSENELLECIKCNVFVHSKCYNHKKYEDNLFVCDVCREFGSLGSQLRCPLCPLSGGLLRPTLIPLSYGLLEKRNKAFYNFYVRKSKKNNSDGQDSNREAVVLEAMGSQDDKVTTTERTELPKSQPEEPHPEVLDTKKNKKIMIHPE